MKTLTVSAALSVAALSSYSLAAITMPIHKGHSQRVSKRDLKLRATTILEELGNNFTGQSYMATVTVGTPPQDVALAIDTGSSDTWVLDSKADLCTDEEYQSEEQTGCQTAFDSGDSSTFKVVKKNAFHITYGDGSGADGDYFTDDFTIGEASINDLQMGIAHNANLTQGLLGIGYSLNEASNYDDPSTEENEAFVYPNLIDAMVSQHLISINAYSLYLDDLDSDSGSIIFGGLDTDKFHGDLVQMPIVPRTLRNGSELFIEFAVALTGVSLSDGSSNKAIPLSGSPPAVVLDSGTALTYLPTTLAESIYDEIGAYDDSSYFGTGLVFADCDLIETGKSFDFKFGGSDGSDSVTIKVPYSEMILFPEKLGFSLDGYIPSDVPFSNVCILGIMSSPEDPYIMGDTFLRSAYVVYDLKNNVIALAQTNFNSDDSNVVDFKAGQTAIPAVSGVASSAGVVETGTGKPGGKTDSEGSTTRRATPRPTSASASGSGSASSRTSSATITDSTATGSGNAGVATVPALDISGLVVLGGATLFAVLGGGWLLA